MHRHTFNTEKIQPQTYHDNYKLNSIPTPQPNFGPEMSLVTGPGRAGISASSLPEELQLSIAAHVKYIQALDKVFDPIQTPES